MGFLTNADPRYAGRLDDKQGGDTVLTMARVREAIAFNVELADESTWLWLTSEQMGFPLRMTRGVEHEDRAQDLDSSQGHATTYLLITWCLRSLTLFRMKIECAATTILDRH